MQLYVGGLSDDIKEVDVEKVFSGVCLPQLVTIIRDIESGKSRGFAIVKILSEEKGRRLSDTSVEPCCGEGILWSEGCQKRYWLL